MVTTTIETKKMETIIEGLENLSIDKVKSAQIILKFSSELKKLGFKVANVSGRIVKDDTVEENLIICFSPLYDNISINETYYRRALFKDITSYLMSLGGSESMDYYYKLCDNAFDLQIPLKIKFKDNDYEIGVYLPTRNIVIMYLPVNVNSWYMGNENKYITQILDWIKELVKNYKIKEESVEKMRKKIFIAKFTKSVNSEISNVKSAMSKCERDIKAYKPRITEWYGEILTSKRILINLGGLLKNIEGGLLKKVEEIKNLKFVKNVELTQEGIVFEIKKIFINVKGKNIEMGDFVITLMPNDIKIKNKKPVKYCGGIYHSPHIAGDDICFGQEKTLAYELLGKMELKKLVHFLYLYLKSYNPEDTYLSMNYWIKGKENNGVVPDEIEAFVPASENEMEGGFI